MAPCWRRLLGGVVLVCVAGVAGAGDGEEGGVPPRGLRVICRNLVEARHAGVYEGILSLEYVSGVLVYVDWNRLEPREGEFAWDLLDHPLALARARGKVVSIGVMVQAFSPTWLLERCGTFSYRHTHPSVGTVESPVPWDRDYVAAIKRMVSALGDRYDGRAGLHCVAMTGPSSLFGVETNFPAAAVSPEMAARLSYTNGKFEAGWKDMIDHYMACFSRTDLSLGMHHDIPAFLGGSREEVMRTVRSIRDHAIARQAERGGGRLVLRLLGLGLDNPKYFPGPWSGSGAAANDYLALVQEVRDRADVAFEVSRVFSRPNVGRPALGAGAFGRVLANGMSYGPRWIEVKEWDVWDRGQAAPYEPYAAVLTEAASVLRVGKD